MATADAPNARASTEPEWMARTCLRDQCPVAHALDILSGRWTTLIVRELLPGARRFGELRRGAGPLAAKTLTERLRRLEAQGIVERRVYAEVPPRVEYTLTDRGRSLEPVLRAMWQWGVEDLGRAQGPRAASTRGG